MNMKEKIPGVRRICPVFFLLDTSGSMTGPPIGAVNSAIENIMPELVSMNSSNADVEINVAIMSFETDTVWITGEQGLVNPADFRWKDLDVGNLTSMGKAFTELEKVLHVNHGEKNFMNRASGSVAPVLFLMSDGEPSDEYKVGLNKLKENNWYKVAFRVAVGYGQSNDAILAEFTGNPETVLHTNDPNELKNMIKIIAVRSSQVASGPLAQDNDDDNTKILADEFQNNPPALAAADADEDW